MLFLASPRGPPSCHCELLNGLRFLAHLKNFFKKIEKCKSHETDTENPKHFNITRTKLFIQLLLSSVEFTGEGGGRDLEVEQVKILLERKR